MPPYLTQHSVWITLWPVPLAALFVGGVLWLIVRPRSDRLAWLLVLLAFAMLGLVTGILAGFSREPAVGAVLPAILSLVGGLAIYLIGSERGDRSLVSLCVVALSFDLLVGATWGAVLRDTADEFTRAQERALTSLESQQQQALVEVKVREFRRALGLPEQAPER